MEMINILVTTLRIQIVALCLDVDVVVVVLKLKVVDRLDRWTAETGY